ncbi:MAG: MMPL family transporter [bacterium]|nr:MMPL family transporter [bacterium]
MTRRALTTLLLTTAFFASTGLYVADRIEITTGLGQFLSEFAPGDLAAVSSKDISSSATRSMVLFIASPQFPAALDAARRWRAKLEQHPEVEAVRIGPDPALVDAVEELYFPRRYFFVSDDPESTVPGLTSPEGLERAARRLREELISPRSPLIKQVAGADPLLVFPEMLERFRELGQGRLQIVRGQFAAPDANAAVILLTTRHSAFASAYQEPFEDFLLRSFAELESDLPSPLTLERSGIHRFAVASERQGVAEMRWMSTTSIAAIAALFLYLFRSPKLLVLAILPLSTGLLAATAASIAIFREIHLTTVVFGSTLIGVCIDYPIHYLCHHTLLPDPDGPLGSIRRVWPAISMGALTTIAGFAGLAGSSFPGIRELGAFAAVGIAAALVATRAILPNLLSGTPSASHTQRRAVQTLARGFRSLERSRIGLRISLPISVLLICVGAPFVTWEDDVFALSPPIDPSWVEEDRRVRAWLPPMDLGRFVVAIADDDQAALELNDTIHGRLLEAKAQGVLEDFRSLHTFLPAASLQQRNFDALRNVRNLSSRLIGTLEREGFVPEAFRAFEETLASNAPARLRFRDFEATPLEPMLSPFRMDLDDRVGVLTFLIGVNEPEQLEKAIADLPGVHYFEQQRFIEESYAHYRKRVFQLVAAGLLAVAALLFARFRSARKTLATVTPALLAALLTLALLSLCGATITLLHLLGLLLVLSIGVDYTIFLVSTEPSAEHRAATLLSLCIACASTCLSFGLLSFSAFPALQALGVSTGLGALLSLILAPSALSLLDHHGDPQ